MMVMKLRFSHPSLVGDRICRNAPPLCDLVLFGTKRLGSVGEDLGSALKGFRKAMSEKDEAAPSVPRKAE